MRGDLEEADQLGHALYARFRTRAATVLKGHQSEKENAASEAGLAIYMEELFTDALSRCARRRQGGPGSSLRAPFRPAWGLFSVDRVSRRRREQASLPSQELKVEGKNEI